ncbi:MAG: hypothetical protein LBO00_06550 [Zoogloeaceae bacterium]|jgi:hypothetical protein|nr:hypothetical protein [Zoogloeaceae bacterium]
MFRFIFLAALCVSGASFAGMGDTITLGEFTIKSVPQKTNGLKIEIFKYGKPFQELADTEWPNYCDVNFLFTESHDRISFGIICDSEYNAAEIEYDIKKQKFVLAGAMEWFRTIHEIKETKDYYIGLTHSTDTEYGKQDGSLRIFKKPSNENIQTITNSDEGNDIFYINVSYCGTEGCLKVGDYNFDGIEDFSLLVAYDRQGNEERTYFLYDPKKKEFVPSEFSGYGLEFDAKTKTIKEDSWHAINHGSIDTHITYKVVNNKMEKIKEECALTYDEETHSAVFAHDCGDNYWEGFTHFSSTGLKKNFEFAVALSGNGKGIVLYKGQSEFITLSLSAKNGDDYIYDEIYNGKKNGQYIFTINEGGEKSASYINKNGKKFNLEPINDERQ